MAGTGIEWQPGCARLWEEGRITARAPHNTAAPFEFWFWHAFRDAFPEVTHWWFGSAWTGKVWVWPAPLAAGSAPRGWMQFGDRTQPPLSWQIHPGGLPRISTPWPALAGDTRNLALRVALAQLVWEIHTDVRPAAPEPDLLPAGGCPLPAGWSGLPLAPPEQGVVIVTSLVERTALDAAFPLTPGSWYPSGVDRPLREAFCRSLGLPMPAWITIH
jgi:hypothetical protein